ncbi:hypothetical protein [Streptomyces sp. NPDC087300]|uniref:hypothetical protein n=1 Tax=Streptomyces sp. NPDC087300 TaxID=3365780 RepID=UPI00382ADDA8
MGDFWVLLGADYCGKSAVLDELAARQGRVLPVSVDPDTLDEEYQVLAELRRTLGRMAPGRHSPDYTMAILNVAVAYHLDRLHRAPDGRTLLLDSYYYKILAKCRLFGLDEEPWRSYWSALPQPAGVVFLDTDPDVTWRRSGSGERLNRLEYHGSSPTRDGFVRFQRELRGALVDGTRHLFVEHVPGDGAGVAATADLVLRAMKE